MEETKEVKKQSVYLVTLEVESTVIEKTMISEIKKFPAWAKVMKGVWLVRTNSGATEIRDKLKIMMNNSDKIFVMKASKGWAFRGVTVGDWIRRNI